MSTLRNHPLYDALRPRWRFLELAYVGGPAFRYPTDLDLVRRIKRILPSEEREAADPSVVELRVGNSFLRRKSVEEDWEWENRVADSYYRNFVRPIVNLFAQTVVSSAVQRDWSGAPILSAWEADADGRGTRLGRVMRHAFTKALLFGHAFALVDLPRLPEGAVPTRADEEALGIRPYARIFSPLQVPDWRVDSRGRLTAVRLVERAPVDAPLGVAAPESRWWRTWWPDRWELWREDRARSAEGDILTGEPPKLVLIAEGPNALGRVPVEVIYGQRVLDQAEPVGLSLVDDVADLNLELFNEDSETQALLAKTAFPQLAVPNATGETSPIVLSLSRTLDYNPRDGGLPAWIGPSVEYVGAHKEHAADLVLAMRAMVGLSRGVAEQSIAARSGDALLIETQDRQAVLADLADEAGDAENRIARMVADWAGETWTGRVSYPHEFATRTFADRLDAALKIAGMQPPAEVRAAVLADVVGQHLQAMPEVERQALTARIREAGAATAPVAAPNAAPRRLRAMSMPMDADEEQLA